MIRRECARKVSEDGSIEYTQLRIVEDHRYLGVARYLCSAIGPESLGTTVMKLEVEKILQSCDRTWMAERDWQEVLGEWRR